MMKTNKKLVLGICLILIGISSCIKPRVELDDSVWGDNAYITAVVLFRYESVTNQLGYNEPVTGYQTMSVSTTSNVISRDQATVTIVAVKGTNLAKIGIRFSHFAKKIEPLDGAPPAGMIGDFSKGVYTYRLYSADGTIRDWKLSFAVAP